MLRKQNIAVGRSYVNEGAHIAREVVEEVDRRKVKYNAFDLVDGRLIPDRDANLQEERPGSLGRP